MLLVYFIGLLFVLVQAKPSLTPPPLALLDIVPDNFLKFFFTLSAAEKSIIEDSFLKHVDGLSNDEKTKLFIDKIKEGTPKLGERLHKVIEELASKKTLLSKAANELFDLFLIKPNVPRNTHFELKRLTQLRLNKYISLSDEDKKILKKQFPEIVSFFDTLVSDKQVREFADIA